MTLVAGLRQDHAGPAAAVPLLGAPSSRSPPSTAGCAGSSSAPRSTAGSCSAASSPPARCRGPRRSRWSTCSSMGAGRPARRPPATRHAAADLSPAALGRSGRAACDVGGSVVPRDRSSLGRWPRACGRFEPWRAFTSSELDEPLPVAAEAAADDRVPRPSPTPTASTEPRRHGPDRTEHGAGSRRPADAGARPELVELARGCVRGRRARHLGRARVIELADGTRFVRLEDLATSDGPDLHVWVDRRSPAAAPGAPTTTAATCASGSSRPPTATRTTRSPPTPTSVGWIRGDLVRPVRRRVRTAPVALERRCHDGVMTTGAPTGLAARPDESATHQVPRGRARARANAAAWQAGWPARARPSAAAGTGRSPSSRARRHDAAVIAAPTPVRRDLTTAARSRRRGRVADPASARELAERRAGGGASTGACTSRPRARAPPVVATRETKDWTWVPRPTPAPSAAGRRRRRAADLGATPAATPRPGSAVARVPGGRRRGRAPTPASAFGTPATSATCIALLAGRVRPMLDAGRSRVRQLGPGRRCASRSATTWPTPQRWARPCWPQPARRPALYDAMSDARPGAAPAGATTAAASRSPRCGALPPPRRRSHHLHDAGAGSGAEPCAGG